MESSKRLESHHPRPPAQMLSLQIDTTKIWVKNWINDYFPTRNTNFDSLMTKYSFCLYRISHYFYKHPFVTIKSEHLLNLKPLVNKSQNIDGITTADMTGFGGNGNDIEIELYTNCIHYTFSYGFGDCYAGCISRIYWEFRVYKDCDVRFLGKHVN